MTSPTPKDELVLADIPERVELRELQAELAQQRDSIAELDLEIENLREQLVAFETHYNAVLAPEHDALTRTHTLTRHFERWSDLLSRHAKRMQEPLAERAESVDRRRQREIGKRRRRRRRKPRRKPTADTASTEPMPVPPPEQRDRRDELKEAYRRLARRFHPDLARTEEERLSASATMTRINALYRAGELERLQALAEQAKGGEIDDPELPIDEQVSALRERRDWFVAVVDNLRDERHDLEASPTCELMRNVDQASAAGHDLIAELREDLQGRVHEAYKDIRHGVRLLEENVARYNREGANAELPARKKGQAMERVFDPFADKKLVRLGLEQIAQARVSKGVQQLADWIEQAVDEQPQLVDLILLTYVCELSPFPLKGLESYDDASLRFDWLAAQRGDARPMSLEQALVDGDDLVEYGVKKATDRLVHTGLRFRARDLPDAVPLALRVLPVRRAFREVLSVLDERVTCEGCRGEVFLVPLYRLRGLDDMRASVCPDCGHAAASYWMPKGKDVQALLNETFLDYEQISEWSFRLDSSSIAIQLVPCQVEAMTVGQLKKRLVDDLFGRHQIEVGRGQVRLLQDGKRIAERTLLAELESRCFVIELSEDAEWSESDALAIVRHRIRHRFT